MFWYIATVGYLLHGFNALKDFLRVVIMMVDPCLFVVKAVLALVEVHVVRVSDALTDEDRVE